MSFDNELRRLADRIENSNMRPLEQPGACEEKKSDVLTSLFGLLAREEAADVTIEGAAFNEATVEEATVEEAAEDAGAADTDVPAGAKGRKHVISESGTPVALALLVDTNEREGEGFQAEDRELLCSSLKASGLRFGLLAGGGQVRFYASAGDLERPVLDFDLLNYSGREARRLKILLRAILAFGGAEENAKSVGRGLFYVLAMDSGDSFGERKTACNFGITGISAESRRQFHEWHLGIRGSEKLRLCFLAAGAIVAAEKIIRRKTGHMAPSGLGPQSEWRWCSPRRLVETVKQIAENQILEESDRLGLGLEHVVLADPLTSSEPMPEGNRSEGRTGTSEEKSADSDFRLGDRLRPETARRRGAEAKRRALRGDLSPNSRDIPLSFLMSDHERSLLEECAEQSAYRSQSGYIRDQVLGWNRTAPLVAKAGLILHWARAHWGRAVRADAWSQLRRLAEDFFNPKCLSSTEGTASGSPSQEDPLRKVLRLLHRHLLATEPRTLQLLKEQLIKMRRFGELEEITISRKPLRSAPSDSTSSDSASSRLDPSGLASSDLRPSGLGTSGPEEKQTGWAREVRRRVLRVSEKESRHRTPMSLRMTSAERTVVGENAAGCSYANPSSYARNYSLGWDRDALVVARAAVVVTWLAGRLGQSIRKTGWDQLRGAIEQAFDPGRLPGGDSVRDGLEVAEEHLLQMETGRVAQETDILRP